MKNFYKDIVEKFPGMFDEYIMPGSLEINSGWNALVINLLTELYNLSPKIKIHQIKEKFGGLRCYLGEVDVEFYAQAYEIIYKYELIASNTCEFCGTSPAQLVTVNRWQTTKCSSC